MNYNKTFDKYILKHSAHDFGNIYSNSQKSQSFHRFIIIPCYAEYDYLFSTLDSINNQNKKFEIRIKKELINEDEIKIDFNFKNPVSPFEVFESPDSRKLGMLIKNIKIEPI